MLCGVIVNRRIMQIHIIKIGKLHLIELGDFVERYNSQNYALAKFITRVTLLLEKQYNNPLSIGIDFLRKHKKLQDAYTLHSIEDYYYTYAFIAVEAVEVGSSSYNSCYGSVNAVDETEYLEGRKSKFYTSEYNRTFSAGPAESGITNRTYYDLKFKLNEIYISHDSYPCDIDDLILI